MKKIIIVVLSLIFLSLCCYFIFEAYKPEEILTTDSIKFSNEYGIEKDNVFVYKTSKEIIEILNNGTGIVYLGFPECSWCKEYVKYLNEVAKENNVKEIYYFNIRKDRSNNTENYQQIVKILEDKLLTNDEGKPVVYVPDVTFVNNGVIVGHDNETSVVTENDGTPQEYWTSEKIFELKNRLSDYIERTKENSCTSCN